MSPIASTSQCPEELLDRLRRFHDDAFAQYRKTFQMLTARAGRARGPCCTEQRAVVRQLERLMDCSMVRGRVPSGQISLHGWHYVIEEGEVHVFDVRSGGFVPASRVDHCGTGPYHPYGEREGPVWLDDV